MQGPDEMHARLQTLRRAKLDPDINRPMGSVALSLRDLQQGTPTLYFQVLRDIRTNCEVAMTTKHFNKLARWMRHNITDKICFSGIYLATPNASIFSGRRLSTPGRRNHAANFSVSQAHMESLLSPVGTQNYQLLAGRNWYPP